MSDENAVTWVPVHYATIVNNLFETKEFAFAALESSKQVRDIAVELEAEKPESFSSQSSSSDLESSPLVTVPTLPGSIQDIYKQRFSLGVVWEVLNKRLDVVWKEYLAHKENKRTKEQKEAEALLTCLYGDFFKLTHALIVLHQKNHETPDSMGVYVNESAYNQLLFPLVQIYYNLKKEFTDASSEIAKKIAKKQPQNQDFFIKGWGGITDDGSLISPYSETITQYFSKDLFIAINNFRLLAVRAKNLFVYFDRGIPTLSQVDLSGFHQFASAVNQASPYLTQLGWAYYTLRILPNILFSFKHVIPGFWMNEHEKNIPWHVRLSNEINKRGFQLANDVVWCVIGTIVCFAPLAASTSIILTASLYVFDVINTLAWGINDLHNLNAIRNKYLEQIQSEIKNKLNLTAEDSLLKDLMEKLSSSTIKQFTFEALLNDPKASHLSADQKKSLLVKLNEFKEQLILVDEKYEARKNLLIYNTAINLSFTAGMGLVAGGLCSGIPILTMIGISIVAITALIQICIWAKGKIQNNSKPVSHSYFFKPDGSVNEIELKHIPKNKAANESFVYYDHAVTLGCR